MIDEKYFIDSRYIMVTLIFIPIVSLWGAYLDNNSAIFTLPFIFIAIGILFISLINRVENIRNSINIFLIFFLIYLTYTFVIHFGLIEYYNTSYPFVQSDEGLFHEGARDVANKFRLSYRFEDIAKIRGYGDLPGSIYFNAQIARLSELFGEHTFLVQKEAVTLVSALIPTIMYSLARLYFNEKISTTVAIVYGLFSFVPYLSSLLLRDAHIALMYITTFYILLERISLIRLTILVLFSIASYYFREQTGIFMVGFTVVYFFQFVNLTVKNNYTRLFVYIMTLIVLILIVLNNDYVMGIYNQTFNSSAEHVAEHTASGSLGAKIAKLPFGLSYITLLGFSQIQPFPPSLIFISKKGMFQFTYLLAGISWYFGWGFLLYGILKKKILKKIELKLIIMFIFSITYLVLVAVIEFNQRRQMAVYPILYIVMVFSYLEMSISERTKVWTFMFLSYVAITLAFNYIKL